MAGYKNATFYVLFRITRPDNTYTYTSATEFNDVNTGPDDLYVWINNQRKIVKQSMKPLEKLAIENIKVFHPK